MEKLENNSAWFKRSTWIHAPFQTIAVGCLYVFYFYFKFNQLVNYNK